MHMPELKRRAFPSGSARLLAVGMLALPFIAQAEPDPNRVRQAVTAAIAETAAEQHMGVDPHLVEAMVASVGDFAGNFCLGANPSTPDTRCAATLFNPSVLRSSVRQFLAESASGATEVTFLGARLAAASGGDYAQIGFPISSPNISGVVALTVGGSAVEKVSLTTASGQMQIAGDVRKLLLQAGQYTLTIRLAGGSETTRMVLVQARKQVAFSDAPSGQATALSGPIDVPAGRFCYDRRFAQTDATPTGPLADFNWGRDQLQGGPTAHLAAIATKYAVDIQVDDQVGECSERCRQAMGVVFSQAIAVWRAGCHRCNPNVLATLKVGDDDVWIDSRLASRLRAVAAGNAASLDLAAYRSDEMTRTIGAPSSISMNPGYEFISSDKILKDTL